MGSPVLDCTQATVTAQGSRIRPEPSQDMLNKKNNTGQTRYDSRVPEVTVLLIPRLWPQTIGMCDESESRQRMRRNCLSTKVTRRRLMSWWPSKDGKEAYPGVKGERTKPNENPKKNRTEGSTSNNRVV